MGRTAEFVLGLIGGILGFLGGLLALAVAGLSAAFGSDGSQLSALGWSALAFSVMGIVGAALVKSPSRVKLGGWLMIVAGIGGVVSISFFFALPLVLLETGGLMALLRKDAPVSVVVHHVQTSAPVEIPPETR